MKKVLFVFTLLCGIFAAASDHGMFRVNFHTRELMSWKASPGVSGGSGRYKDAKGLPFYELLLTKDLSSVDWTPVEITVTPKKTENGAFELMVYPHPRKPWIRIKDLKITGSQAANTGFKAVNGRIGSWRSSGINLLNCSSGEVRVSYANGIAQQIPYTAGTPVKVSMMVRLEQLQQYGLPAPKAPGKVPVIVLAGDSTVCAYNPTSKPLTGWGEMLPVKAGVAVKNCAVGGESTKSFLNRKRWYNAVVTLRKNDFMMIQFGHNDQGRYGTSIAQYRENLRKMISDVRQMGAIPVLVTPVCRRQFFYGIAINPLFARALAMKETAKAEKVDLIDLNSLSFDLLKRLGDTGSRKLYNHLKPGESPNFPKGSRDDSHFNAYGAKIIAALIANEAAKRKLAIAEFLEPVSLPAFPAKPKVLPPPAKAKLRLDIITPTAGSFDLSGGIVKEASFTRDGKGALQSYVSLYRSLEQEKWVTVDFSFFPAKSEDLRLRILAAGVPAGQELWLLVDKVTVSGAKLLNPDFKEVDPEGKSFAHWAPGGYAMNFACLPDLPGNRPYCAKVNYRNFLEQSFAVTKGRQVSISIRLRPLKLNKVTAAADENIVFDPDTAVPVLISKGYFNVVPTFENCGVYILRKPGQAGKKLECRVFSRKRGTAEWLPALKPVEIAREKAWRVSLLGLQENTDYDCKAELLENGKVIDTMEKLFRTQNSKVNIARTIEIDPAAFSGSMTKFQSGKPSGYIRYTMKKGGVLKGGVFDAVLCASKVHHVIFEGLTVDANRARSALCLDECSFIQVRNCRFYNFGRSDWVRDYRMGGVWTSSGRATGWDGGIRLENSGNILVERCYIHDPYSSANSWFYSHPTGPEAVFVNSSKGNIVLRYNDFIGSDKRRWNDAVECAGNFDADGGLMRDSDVYGNHFAFTNDDAVELEGGGMNQRFYLNYIDRCFTGVSTGNTMLGPSYIYRNLFGILGDECGRTFAPFKNGGSGPSYGTVYLLNNTVGFPRLCTYGGIGSAPDKSIPVKMFIQNNLIRSGFRLYGSDFPRWNLEIDYNVNELSDADKLLVQKQWSQYPYDKHSLWRSIPYADREKGDFRLKEKLNMPAGMLALAQPGAFQNDGITSLPYRPVDLELFPKILLFPDVLKNARAGFSASAGKNFSGKFTVYCNDDFFTVTPKEGSVKPGEKVNFTVTLDPGKMPRPRLYNGVILVRFEDGFSRAVSLQADLRFDKERIAAAEKHAVRLPMKDLPGNGTFETTVNIPEDGCYFVFVRGKIHGSSVCDMELGGEKTDRRTARLISSGPEHEGERFVCLFNGGGGLCGWYFHLTKGPNKMVFKPGLAPDCRLKTLFLTREPELFLNR